LVISFSLADGLPDSLSPHRATYDALVAARLFVQLATRDDGTPRSLKELRDQKPGGDSDEDPSLFYS
jgi:DNA polymerase III epsilon subunit-like protein